jgi:multiple sugar transport system substrate-binding protein
MFRLRQARIALVAAAMAFTIVGGSAGGAFAQDEKITLNMIAMAQAGMTPDEMNAVVAEFVALNPNVEIVADYVAYDALHDKIATGMAAGQSPFDIMLVDDIWFPEFAEAGWLKDISAEIPAEMKADSSPAAWDIVSYDGKQYGLPWLLDQLYLYYNTDMLAAAGFDAPPTTWEEMMTMAQAMKDQGIVDNPIVLSWGQIEAVITEFVAFLYGNGGQFFDESGAPVFNSPEAVAVLQWMVDAVKSGLVNPASTTYGEEDSRNTISAGKAAFTVNWAYMLDLANNPDESTVAGKIAMALMPVFQAGKDAGIESSSNNGSMGFGISAGSEHADMALAFIEYLTSKDVQKRYAAHVTPLWTSLYSDPELLAAQPVLLDMFAKQWPTAHVRPKVPYYLEMSQTLQVAIQEALIGAKSPQQALDEAVAAAAELAAQ